MKKEFAKVPKYQVGILIGPMSLDQMIRFTDRCETEGIYFQGVRGHKLFLHGGAICAAIADGIEDELVARLIGGPSHV